MTPSKTDPLLARISRRAAVIGVVIVVLVFAFTNSPICCIMAAMAATIGITGFFLVQYSLDRLLRGGEKRYFVLFSLLKLVVIALTFIWATTFSQAAILSYLAGISVLVLSLLGEGVLQIFGRNRHGA